MKAIKVIKAIFLVIFVVTFKACYTPIVGFESISIMDLDTKISDKMNIESAKSKTKDSINIESNNIESTKSAIKDSINTESKNKNTKKLPFLFYRECSKSGSAWLYTCQIIGLKSLYNTISLISPHTNSTNELRHIKMFFYPKKDYIRYEIYNY